jgi:hypothetical protein
MLLLASRTWTIFAFDSASSLFELSSKETKKTAAWKREREGEGVARSLNEARCNRRGTR